MINKSLAALIEANTDLVVSTAIKNCHVIGLHSFIVSQYPKIRLFIADDNCVLREPFDIKNPVLTIHKHKHNDVFIPLTKTKLTHHLYKLTTEHNDNSISFSMINYSRLDADIGTHLIGSEWLDYIESKSLYYMDTGQYHTVSINGCDKCSWLVLEMGTNNSFDNISYGGLPISHECYSKFDDPLTYVRDYLGSL